MKRLWFGTVLGLMIFWAGNAAARQMYVSDVITVTLRRGPGVSHKVIGEPKSGQIVDALDNQGSWTYVRLPDGKTGWILTRFLTANKPKGLLLESLQEKHKDSASQIETLKAEKERLTTENEELTRQLEDFRKSFDDVSSSYETLKGESTHYLSLKQKYEAAVNELSSHESKTTELSEKLDKLEWRQNLIMWSGGAAVFFIGFIFGGIRSGSDRRGRF